MTFSPTISSPSAEDFSGLTLVGCSVAGGKISSTNHVGCVSETWSTLDASQWDFIDAESSGLGLRRSTSGTSTTVIAKRVVGKTFSGTRSFTAIATLPMSDKAYAVNFGILDYDTAAWIRSSIQFYTSCTVNHTGIIGQYVTTFSQSVAIPGLGPTDPVMLKASCVNGLLTLSVSFNSGSSWSTVAIMDIRAFDKYSAFISQYFPKDGSGPNGISSVVISTSDPVSAELPTTAAFSPTGGLNLARLLSITPTLDSTGASGTVTLSLQKFSTEHGWTSLGGVADAWTSLGACVSGAPIDLSSYEMRAGAALRWKAEFASTDGTLPPPALSGLALAWESDTDAPGVPTITQLLSSCGVGGVGPRPVIQISSLPTGARHIEVEVDRKPDGGDWAGSLPLSGRNAVESGQGYLELRGARAAEQGAGEENALHLAIPGTWAVGDEVRAKARAVDAMGNASAWTDTTAAVEITQPYPAPTITEVTPTPLAEAGGTEITITGTCFIDGATVTVAGDACTDVVVVSNTEITATTPASEYGARTLTVTNPDGQDASLAVQVGATTAIPVLVNGWRGRFNGNVWRGRWK